MNRKVLFAACALAASGVSAQSTPFDTCPTQAFLMQGQSSQLYSVDLATGYYETLDESILSGTVNAIAFSNHDSYLYGWSKNDMGVVRIGADFAPQQLGQPSGLPANLKSFYVGDVSLSTNEYYLYRKDSTHGLYKVSLDESDTENFMVAKKIIDGANLELRIYDFAFHPTNGFLYSVDRQGLLLKIDPAAGTAQTLATLDTTGTFGAVYFDADGNLYYSRNADGHIFRIDPEAANPTPVLFAYGPKSSQNDGARCALAPAVAETAPTIDFGDAPDSYGTTFESNGARHNVENNTLTLGASRDPEADAYVFPVQDDDVDEGNDDGIQILSPIIAGENTVIRVTSSGSGNLAMFFDWNGDGDFDDANENVGDASVNLGDQLLNISVPVGAVAGDTWARFRLSSTSNLGATGGASDGEVEDYAVKVLPCNCSVETYPSGGDVVTLAYEDLWPSKGDYDMNDLVVHYRTSAVKSGSNIVSVTIEGEIAAVGADFHNGFAVHVPGVDSANVDEANIVYKLNGVPVNRDPLEAGRDQTIIVVADDVWDEIEPTPTCGFYRTQLACDEPIFWSFSIEVPFEFGVDEATVGELLFNPFLFGANGHDRNPLYNPTNGRDLEVHLKNFVHTEAADVSFLDRAWDASVPAQSLYYLGDNGIPFALEIGTEWAHPLEGVDIVEAYPDFINYVLSGGTTHQDWYLRENAVESKIYPH